MDVTRCHMTCKMYAGYHQYTWVDWVWQGSLEIDMDVAGKVQLGQEWHGVPKLCLIKSIYMQKSRYSIGPLTQKTAKGFGFRTITGCSLRVYRGHHCSVQKVTCPSSVFHLNNVNELWLKNACHQLKSRQSHGHHLKCLEWIQTMSVTIATSLTTSAQMNCRWNWTENFTGEFFRWFKLKTNPYTGKEDWLSTGEYWKRNWQKCPDLYWWRCHRLLMMMM